MTGPVMAQDGNKRVGLLGGSFNPAHEGHLHISHMCLKALALDCVWWLVSPQNPLKGEDDMAPLDARLEGAQKLLAAKGETRITATDIEVKLGTRFTIDTMRALKQRHTETHFVWLMGADNMIQLPRWRHWEELVREMPIAIYPRPGFTEEAKRSDAASLLKNTTLHAEEAALLADKAPPALVFLDGPEHPASATAIRKAERK